MKFWTHLLSKGFGSFVEKTVMPYISTTPAKLLNPCTGDQNCTSPFSYKNVLKLTSDGKKFNTLVGQQHISGNLDSPEGGFDAIMQVAVCRVSKKESRISMFPCQWSCEKKIGSGSVWFSQKWHTYLQGHFLWWFVKEEKWYLLADFWIQWYFQQIFILLF